MATTDNNIQYDQVFFEEFFHTLKINFTKKQLEAIKMLSDLGLLQRDRLVELAISKATGIGTDSTNGQDFVNGADSKSVVLSMRNNVKAKGEWTSSFLVRRIAGKNGDLFVVGYNKILKKFHYFKIPHKEYQHLDTVLEIVVEKYYNVYEEPNWTGNRNVNCKWWDYEVDSLEDLK